jgi:hypothetical protein
MRHTLFVFVAVAFLDLSLGRAASAADLPVKAPAYTPIPCAAPRPHLLRMRAREKSLKNFRCSGPDQQVYGATRFL